jgi:hypothetical protein
VGQYYDPAAINVVVFSEALNCLEGGGTTSACYQDYVTFYNTAHSAGWKVVACSPTARSVSGSYTEAKRQTVLTSITNNWSAVSDTNLCHPGIDAIIGNPANLTNVTYFQDQAHLANGGARIYANYVTAAIRAVLGR